MKLTAQDLRVMDFVARNPGCSTNKVYVACSDACQRRGLTKSIGTSSWTRPKTMQARGLVQIVDDRSGCEKARAKGHMGADVRSQIRYHWYLTSLGMQLLLNQHPAYQAGVGFPS